MRRQQSLVGGHHRLPEFQGREDHRAGNRRAPGQFCHQVHLWILHYPLPIRAHDGPRNPVRARLVNGFNGDFLNRDPHANARGQKVAIPLERVKHTATHSAATDHSQIYLVHRITSPEACRKSGAGTMNF